MRWEKCVKQDVFLRQDPFFANMFAFILILLYLTFSSSPNAINARYHKLKIITAL